MIARDQVKKISDLIWEIPQSFRSDMKVPARIFASEQMLEEILEDRSLEQLVNVATLPGIQKNALAMPDIHEGYGFPIGGVAATKFPDGVISPGGIGYDINCGVRLLLSSLTTDDLRDKKLLANELFQAVPSGVGRGGALRLDEEILNGVLAKGAYWAVENGYADSKDLEKIESRGRLEPSAPDKISKAAKRRGHDQLGTIGAGNHFVEVGEVSEIYDEKSAQIFGLRKNQLTILIHTGSRGLGHQVATDYIRIMLKEMPKYGISLPDRELACVPFSSPEGADYFQAMAAAANFAFVNRQIITWEIRKVWREIFGESGNLGLLYDVAHNIAKVEEHEINGKNEKLILHRKGATRAFPPLHPDIPGEYKEAGQPVLIPGSMGTASYVLAGMAEGMRISFGTSCHGAGRKMSRHAAKKEMGGRDLLDSLEQQNITIQTGSVGDLSEEAPFAYKDIHNVVEVIDKLNIAKRVVKLKPLVVIKG